MLDATQKPSPENLPSCFQCRTNKHVECTVTTDSGFYSRCAKCGRVWHTLSDSLRNPPLAADRSLKRQL